MPKVEIDCSNTKVHVKYDCETCQYKTDNKRDYTKHLDTSKHKKLNKNLQDVNNVLNYSCDCGKNYKHKQSLCKHKKKCIKYMSVNESDKTVSKINKKYEPESESNMQEIIKMMKIQSIANNEIKGLLIAFLNK